MIYDIFEPKEKEEVIEKPPQSLKDRFFSSLASRLFFFLLLIADLLWAAYAISLLLLSTALVALCCNQVSAFKSLLHSSWISVRRAITCGLSLFIALFSPAFGIMVACTYFLMYDKAGVEEIVPASLQEQFKEFFQA